MELIPHRWRKDLTVAAGGKDEVHKCPESWTHTALHTLYCLTLFVNCVCVCAVSGGRGRGRAPGASRFTAQGMGSV